MSFSCIFISSEGFFFEKNSWEEKSNWEIFGNWPPGQQRVNRNKSEKRLWKRQELSLFLKILIYNNLLWNCWDGLNTSYLQSYYTPSYSAASLFSAWDPCIGPSTKIVLYLKNSLPLESFLYTGRRRLMQEEML